MASLPMQQPVNVIVAPGRAGDKITKRTISDGSGTAVAPWNVEAGASHEIEGSLALDSIISTWYSLGGTVHGCMCRSSAKEDQVPRLVLQRDLSF